MNRHRAAVHQHSSFPPTCRVGSSFLPTPSSSTLPPPRAPQHVSPSRATPGARGCRGARVHRRGPRRQAPQAPRAWPGRPTWCSRTPRCRPPWPNGHPRKRRTTRPCWPRRPKGREGQAGTHWQDGARRRGGSPRSQVRIIMIETSPVQKHFLHPGSCSVVCASRLVLCHPILRRESRSPNHLPCYPRPHDIATILRPLIS